jgi:hypothetical protein
LALVRYLTLGLSIDASMQTFHSGPRAWMNPLSGLDDQSRATNNADCWFALLWVRELCPEKNGDTAVRAVTRSIVQFRRCRTVRITCKSQKGTVSRLNCLMQQVEFLEPANLADNIWTPQHLERAQAHEAVGVEAG